MERTLLFSIIILWTVVLINLLLTLRVVRWLRAVAEIREQAEARVQLPELTIGTAALDFKAKTLAGETVKLVNYNGCAVAFIFVSPDCGGCRMLMPMLAKLGPQAKARAGVEVVLVSDADVGETWNWLNTIQMEDSVDLQLQVLVAPVNQSEFQLRYNPRGIYPYYCFIDVNGIVQARDPLGKGEWASLKRSWEGSNDKHVSPAFVRRH